LVRKVLGQIAAKNFVSVQPMNLPAGLVFFMDFQYNNARGDRAVNESIYGVTSGSGDLPRDGFYGAGRFGYSVNEITAAVSDTPVDDVAPIDINFETTSSALVRFAVARTDLPGADFSGIRTFTPSGSGADIAATFLPQFTRLTTNSVEFFVTSGSDLTIDQVTYSKQPVETDRGDFEDRDPISNPNGGTNLNIPEINIQLRSETIAAKTRKLKAVWSPELAQDLNAYHSVDAEAELTAMLSDHISLEIDLEILDMLIVNATTTDYWSAEIGRVWDGSCTTEWNRMDKHDMVPNSRSEDAESFQQDSPTHTPWWC
jgi:hypothetical protein